MRSGIGSAPNAFNSVLTVMLAPPAIRGVVTISGTLAMLIPPSIALVLYGLVAQVSIGKLLIDLAAFDLATGERLWRVETEGRIKSAPMIAGGMLIVLVEDRSVLAFTPGGTP